jgi:hypothetical protein
MMYILSINQAVFNPYAIGLTLCRIIGANALQTIDIEPAGVNFYRDTKSSEKKKPSANHRDDATTLLDWPR